MASLLHLHQLLYGIGERSIKLLIMIEIAMFDKYHANVLPLLSAEKECYSA